MDPEFDEKLAEILSSHMSQRTDSERRSARASDTDAQILALANHRFEAAFVSFARALTTADVPRCVEVERKVSLFGKAYNRPVRYFWRTSLGLVDSHGTIWERSTSGADASLFFSLTAGQLNPEADIPVRSGFYGGTLERLRVKLVNPQHPPLIGSCSRDGVPLVWRTKDDETASKYAIPLTDYLAEEFTSLLSRPTGY